MQKIISGGETWKQSKFAMEKSDFPVTQESLHVEITNEVNACHFLQYQDSL
jgi:hypothetical protein